MKTTVILICAFAAFVLALIFFGVLSKGNSDVSTQKLSAVSGVEKEYDKHMRMIRKCTVVYISFFYDALGAKNGSGALFEGLSLAERKTLALANDVFAVTAKVDGNNYILCSSLDFADVKTLCEQFISGFADKNNIAGVHLGGYLSEDTGLSFKRAAGFAKKAARYAKSKGFSCQFCTADSLNGIIENEKIEFNIEAFIDNNHFYLLYQPLIDAKTQKIVGCEALTRLASENEKSVLPYKFLDAVKKENLNKKFDLYIFEKCCEWIRNNGESDVAVACNFSRAALAESGITDELSALAAKTGVNPKKITLEITNEFSNCDFDTMKENVRRLKQAGFRICLDDFGKGHMALNELSALMPDVIGIDKTLLHNADTEQGKAVFASAVHMAKELKARVLCVGIETEEQAKLAKEAGCDLLQGYFFFKPMPVKELEAVFCGEKNRKN